MRIDRDEKAALRFALKDFKGDAYLFGSRLNDKSKGGDIDLFLIPRKKTNTVRLSLKIQARFFSKCEEKIDVVVSGNNLHSQEILKNAKKINFSRI
ncbi:MAG: nucleotidyltransferase domain-containing protein [Elusimicrobiota bacterium]